MMHHIRRTALGFGVRAGLADVLAPRDPLDEETLRDIDDLARDQMQVWAQQKFSRSWLLENFEYLHPHPCLFILKIEGTTVTVQKKPEVAIPPEERPKYERLRRSYDERIHCYRIFLQRVLERSGLDLHVTLAMNADDIGLDSSQTPLFAFQKREGSLNPLLPDAHFLYSSWYWNFRDTLSYDDKRIAGCFAGSSTGGSGGSYMVDEEVVREGRNPRLRAAAHFVKGDLVDFRITRAVQCANPEIKAWIEAQPYFTKPIGYREQFKNRFLVSMDGNGAAWSRYAIGLKSNSAIIKYESPYVLYYFPKMTAGREYLSVSSEAEVERIVELERRRPGAHRHVAEAGRRFFGRYLRQDRVIAYTAALLRRYSEFYHSLS
jgi:hypothetical protein